MSEATTKSHKKRDSFHRRRALELSNAGAMADIDKHEVHSSMSSTPFDRNTDLWVGNMVKIKNYKDIGKVMWMDENGEMIGIELEGASGTGDGTYLNARRFLSPPNCAIFIPREQITHILEVQAPPRFTHRQHDLHIGDIVMVSKAIGVGVIKHASTHLIGCAFNAPVGDTDGSLQGQRYFQVKPSHGKFLEPHNVKKIEAEDLLNKLNETVERLQEIERDLQSHSSLRR